MPGTGPRVPTLYDAWGNLYQKNPCSPAGENLVKTADTNNRLSGLSYDAAGNVINDGTGNTFVYDAENRIISSTNGGVTTTYTYDAGGQRIQKASGSTVTNYWLGLAETDSSGNITNYIFFAGQRLARNIPQPSPTSRFFRKGYTLACKPISCRNLQRWTF